MKAIQYIVDMTYNREETLKVAGVLFITLLKVMKKIKSKGHTHYTNKEFAIYPVNANTIARVRKLVMVGQGKGEVILEAIDELFVEEIAKQNLKILRSENVS
jgi:roadblock/LC7 domain-containing protein